jgi:hypothetical protein
MRRLLLAATVCVALAGCAHAQRTGATVPAVQARRMAAEFGTFAFAPQWLPGGYHFASWSDDLGGPAGSQRLVLHFKRDAADLKWEVTFSDWLREPLVHCSHDGVFFRESRGRAVAWICGDVTISVSQRTRGEHRVSRDELKRVVSSNLGLGPGNVAGGRFQLAPSAEVQRIRAAFAPHPVTLPTRLPSGFLFTSWSVTDNRYDGTRDLGVTFGRDGQLLVWSIIAGKGPGWSDCGDLRSAMPRATIGGKAIFYRVGIHGDSAFTCAPELEHELWIDNHGDRPSAREAMQIVATAR